MRYTNYILHGNPVNFDDVGVIAIPAAFVAVPVLLGFLGGAVVIDGGRLLKLRYYQYLKAQRRERYLKSVVISLGHSKDEWIILKAA